VFELSENKWEVDRQGHLQTSPPTKKRYITKSVPIHEFQHSHPLGNSNTGRNKNY